MAIRIGKTERRLAVAILVTALVPLTAALLLANSLFSRASAVWFNPEIGQELDRGVAVYKDYVKAIKDGMRYQTDAVAADEPLIDAARRRDTPRIEARLHALFPRFPELVVLLVEDAEGNTLARRDRGRPVNEAVERSLDVRHALGSGASAASIVATFAIDRKRLDELEGAGTVVRKYHTLEASRTQVYEPYVLAFAAVLGITMVLTLVLGTILARGVTRRINRLALAINLVAEGDLSVRVPVTGSDELTDLARTFNRMLGDMAQSRARIEFLQRMGAWQGMAQRLAHEIKNPLTPIQLAVQECHRKYSGDDARFRSLLDTTLEIVEEEVGTLRRLVGNFSAFARLPTSELKEASLRDFLRECSEQLSLLAGPNLGSDDSDEEPTAPEDSPGGRVQPSIDFRWVLPDAPLLIRFDRQMLRRVLVNLVRNAAQAIRDARPAGAAAASGRVVVSAYEEPGGVAIEVADDGPGISEGARARVFDPYFTTKTDGTGLGLAIVKKIVVEHGGTIEARGSEALGGASFVVHLPDPQAAGPLSSKIPRDDASYAELQRAGEV